MATSKIRNLPSIVEQGTSGKWTYRKWSDGTAECWYNTAENKTGVSKTVLGISGYEYDFGVLNYPIEFASIPTAVVTGSVGTNYAVVSYSRVLINGVSVSLQSPASGPAEVRLSIYVVGKRN